MRDAEVFLPPMVSREVFLFSFSRCQVYLVLPHSTGVQPPAHRRTLQSSSGHSAAYQTTKVLAHGQQYLKYLKLN